MYRWLSIAFVFFIILASGCITGDDISEEEFSFSSGPCNPDVDPYDPKLPVVTQEVWSGQTLNVKGTVTLNCAESMSGGEYEVSGNTLILRYIAPKCTMCTDCNCAHEVAYTISGLEVKDYDVQLVRSFGIIYRG